MLYFVSERRRIKFKGHSFREFHQRVIPLLDGRHTMHQIKAEVRDVFAPQDLEAALKLLGDQKLLEDGPEEIAGSAWSEALTPQLNLFREIGLEPEQVQLRLKNAVTVTFLGLGRCWRLASSDWSCRCGCRRGSMCWTALPITASDISIFARIFLG